MAWLGPRQRTTLLAVGFQFIGFVYWQSLADRKTFISTVVSCHDNAGKVNPSQISGSGIEWRLRLWCDSVDQVDIRTKRGHWPISSLPTADFLSSERAYLYAKCFFNFGGHVTLAMPTFPQILRFTSGQYVETCLNCLIDRFAAHTDAKSDENIIHLTELHILNSGGWRHRGASWRMKGWGVESPATLTIPLPLSNYSTLQGLTEPLAHSMSIIYKNTSKIDTSRLHSRLWRQGRF